MESNTWCPRLTAAMILSGSAVQVKGMGSLFVSATKRLIAGMRVMEIPVRMRQTRMRRIRWESSLGFKCQI